MRERLAKDKGATYTYSMDYVSQTVSLVDEFRVKEDQEVGTPTDRMDGLAERMTLPPPTYWCSPRAVRSGCLLHPCCTPYRALA